MAEVTVNTYENGFSPRVYTTQVPSNPGSQRFGGGPAHVTFLRRLAIGFAAVATASLGTVAVVTAPSSGASTVNKTVVVWAETPGASPNYIFPYMTGAYFDGPNIERFQPYMFRPLYWFGTKAEPTLNEALSLAAAPVMSNGNKTARIVLKPYKWSNGAQVTTKDVMFWLNIWHQKPTGYAGWFPGGLSMPTSISSVKIVSPTVMTINFKQSFNPHWLLYNELSQITPLPIAWTKTSTGAAAGSAGCATAGYGTDDAACKAVYVFLSEQSGFNPTHPKTTIDALPTYATNPLWQVVDGPWRLKSFEPTEPVVMVPNTAYSGPNKPTYKEFIEKPFTTASAEFNALVNGTVDVGELPGTEVTSPATSPSSPSQTVTPGKNNTRLASTFDLLTVYDWGFNYLPMNFNSTGDTGNAGSIFRQLYLRQAMQSLVDQKLYIDRLERGYGVPTYGPVPIWPHNPFSSKFEESDPYPYDPSHAKQLLSSHGWKVVPGGTDVCTRPGTGAGDCGKGVKKGAKLDFSLQYISGTRTITAIMDAEKASWGEVGIHVNLSSATVDTVVADATPCAKGCKWQLTSYGLIGWGYLPDYYPTGEEIFATGAESNSGSFDTAQNNANIRATDLTDESLVTYENYLAKELPVIWEPESVEAWEYHKGLEHPPIAPLDRTPATLHWS